MRLLLILIALLFVGWTLYGWWKKSNVNWQALPWPKIALYSASGLLLIAVLTGKAPAIMALIGAVFAFFTRFAGLALRHLPFLQQLWKNQQNQQKTEPFSSQEQVSTVNTNWLSMQLFHTSGDMDGDVLIGEFSGFRLSNMTKKQLTSLAETLAEEDQDSLNLLITYYQSRFNDSPFESSSEHKHHQSSNHNSSDLEINEAWDILGLQPGANRDDIILAHKRLMIKLHPDKGGSDWLAARVNRAKDLLLSQIK